MSNANLACIAHTTAASTEPVHVEFLVLNGWSTSYQGRFTVRNESPEEISNWSIFITGSPLNIRDTWGSFNIEVTKVDNGLYLVEGGGRTLQPGESASVTYTGNGSAPANVQFVSQAQAICEPTPTPDPVQTIDMPTGPIAVEFSVLDSWSASYQGRFTITNESAAAIDTWSVFVTGSPLGIRDTWGSFDIEIIKIEDGLYRVEGSGKTLQPGESAFVTYTGNGSAPSDVTIVEPSPDIEDPAPEPRPKVVDADSFVMVKRP